MPALPRLSAALASLERGALIALMGGIAALVLANVGLRAAGVTLAWADELAVHGMILSAFPGASLMLRARTDPAMLLLHESVGPSARRALRAAVSAVCAGFGLVLLYAAWRWFDPVALAASGFDVAAFEAATFNFVYTDVTPVMGLPRWWFYLVMPWFGVSVTVHALANLSEDLGLNRRPADPAGTGDAKGGP